MDSDVTGIILYLLLYFMLFMVIVAIAALIWRAITRVRRPEQQAKSPLTMLEERLARGEIDADDFQERRAFIEDGR